MPRTPKLEQLESRLVPSVSATFGVGPDKVGVFRNGTWVLDNNGNRTLDAGDATFVFGRPGDIPVVGDWNGDSHTKVGIFRNVNGLGEFVLDTNGDRVFDAGDQVFFFGLGTDHPIVGDWDGSGRSKIGVVRDNGQGTLVFSLDFNGDGVFDVGDQVFTFGRSGDKVVIGDWNGDRRAKVGVVRATTGGVAQWFTDFNGDHVFGAGDQVFNYGLFSDTPVVGDWTGANRDSPGVARNSGTGLLWSIDFNGNHIFDPGDLVFVFGASGDIPVAGKW
jgi:hypothetical protein